MNESQRAIVAAKLANMQHGGKRRGVQDANLHLEISREAAAEMLNVSPRQVADAKDLLEDAEAVDLIESGESTVHREKRR